MSDPHEEFKGKNVLIERNSPSEMASKFGIRLEDYLDIIGECKRKLFEVRSRRPKPHLDDKVLPLLLFALKGFLCTSTIYVALLILQHNDAV